MDWMSLGTMLERIKRINIATTTRNCVAFGWWIVSLAVILVGGVSLNVWGGAAINKPDHGWNIKKYPAGFDGGQFFAILVFVIVFPLGWLMNFITTTSIVPISTGWRRAKIVVHVVNAIVPFFGALWSSSHWGNAAACLALVCPFKDPVESVHPAPFLQGAVLFLVPLSATFALCHLWMLSSFLWVTPETRTHEDAWVQRGYTALPQEERTDANLDKVTMNATAERQMGETMLMQIWFRAFWLSAVCFICFVTTAILPPHFTFFTSQLIYSYGNRMPTQAEELCLLGSIYENVTVDNVHRPTCPELPGAYFRTTYCSIGSNAVLKFYPDTMLFYGFLVVVVILGSAYQSSGVLQRFFQTSIKVTGNFKLLCLGYSRLSFSFLMLFTAFMCFMILQFVYWYHDHNYNSNWPAHPNMSLLEKFARTMGQMAVVSLGLLMLPTSRSSPFTKALGISWESFIVLHRLLAYLCLLTGLIHAVSWWIFWLTGQASPLQPTSHDVKTHGWFNILFKVPSWYHSDNWTIPMMTVIFFLSLPILGILTFHKVRRTWFELFYYTHFWSTVFVLAVLWHGNSSWYFLLVGCTLWMIDRIKRLIRSSRPTKINTCTIQEGFIHLALKCPKSHGFQAGQYGFLNCPNISPLQWHPFSISSSPFDSVLSFHMKDMGSSSFTGGLRDFIHQWHTDLQACAASGGAGAVGAFSNSPTSSNKHEMSSLGYSHSSNAHTSINLEDVAYRNPLLNTPIFRVDFPYGTPPNLFQYDKVILIAGGVGITPIHSMMKMLLHIIQLQTRYKFHCPVKTDTIHPINSSSMNGYHKFSSSYSFAGRTENASFCADKCINKLKVPKVIKLVWITRMSEHFLLFQPTLQECKNLESSPFIINLFTTRDHLMSSPTLRRMRTNSSASHHSSTTGSSSPSKPSVPAGGTIYGTQPNTINQTTAGGPEDPSTMYYAHGRPDLEQQISSIKLVKGERGLLFSCGPPGLMDACLNLGLKYGWMNHVENFFL